MTGLPEAGKRTGHTAEALRVLSGYYKHRDQRSIIGQEEIAANTALDHVVNPEQIQRHLR